MSRTLYFHPFSSFCQKVLIALYENGTEFEPLMIDLGDEASRAVLLEAWPMGKFPVLRDEDRGLTLPEASIIVEHLDRTCPGAVRFIPDDADEVRETRLWDRFHDLYVNVPMQKIVTDRLRPEGQSDSFGVEEARRQLKTAFDIADKAMAERRWAAGERFTMADCAAAPALAYADVVMPFADTHAHLHAYLERMKARPSFARVLEEAKPYWTFFPKAA